MYLEVLTGSDDFILKPFNRLGIDNNLANWIGAVWKIFTVIWTLLVLIFLIRLNKKMHAIADKSLEASTLSRFIMMKTSWEGFSYLKHEGYDQELYDRFSADELEVLFKLHHIYKTGNGYSVFKDGPNGIKLLSIGIELKKS